MTRLAFILALCSLLLSARADDRVVFAGIEFTRYEIPFYTFAEYTPQVALRMDYAKFELKNSDEWLKIKAHNIPYEIDLVFTKYPEKIEHWRTNYYELLGDRIRTLLGLDSAFTSAKIRWNMLLQTQCDSEEKAKQYFHGFVIKYRPRKVPFIDQVKGPEALRALISGKAASRDSTVFKVMERHPEWNRLLVVMDWTGSMYKHGAQLALWHKLTLSSQQPRVQHFVFFNDGNHKKSWQKRLGRTGGVYRAKSGQLEEIIQTMEYVMKKGNGGDPEENDIEALLTGVQYLEDFDEVILIADNKSDVRDMELLNKVDKPVRIILCDYRGQIHPHYLEIARATGGSLHTLEKDLTNLIELPR